MISFVYEIFSYIKKNHLKNPDKKTVRLIISLFVLSLDTEGDWLNTDNHVQCSI